MIFTVNVIYVKEKLYLKMDEFLKKLDEIIKSYEDIVLDKNTTSQESVFYSTVLVDLMNLRYDPTGEKRKLWAT